ncbi:hypothetical protein CHS0354_026312 [Potamilus streckersoni]|uniref:Uncharacterized protein n=1 Tax=Potamilus streckersoni TaxID=2493646 RepID=A0AAE0TC21_9BIVA|nr:hypothetical protein CHS0354_026312 [Potamilus streckersoni]
MIVGGEGSEVTPSAKKNKITDTGRRPRSSRDQTTEQSKQSLKLEKDLELIASAWRDMTEKERKVKDFEEEKRELQEELRSKELILMKLKDKRDSLRLQREVNARMFNTTERTEKALVEKTKEYDDIPRCIHLKYTKFEKDKKDLETKHDKLKQMNRKTLQAKQTLEELKTALEYEVSRLRYEMYRLKQKSKNLEIFYIQQIEDGSSTIQNQALIIQQLNEEMKRLTNRLSTISSDRLTHENVTIANLSDPDRPTKLSEVYLELYDNEWTDAFEELTSKDKLSEKRAIEFLLQILLVL